MRLFGWIPSKISLVDRQNKFWPISNKIGEGKIVYTPYAFSKKKNNKLQLLHSLPPSPQIKTKNHNRRNHQESSLSTLLSKFGVHLKTSRIATIITTNHSHQNIDINGWKWPYLCFCLECRRACLENGGIFIHLFFKGFFHKNNKDKILTYKEIIFTLYHLDATNKPFLGNECSWFLYYFGWLAATALSSPPPPKQMGFKALQQ